MTSPAPSSAARKKILVVEDDLLIAMELEMTLEEGGYEVLGPVNSVAAALTLLGQHRPDAGVLDVNLRGEQVTPVARVLKAEGVPFLLSSAYDQARLDGEAAFAGIVNVGKPAAPDRLLAALRSLFEA